VLARGGRETPKEQSLFTDHAVHQYAQDGTSPQFPGLDSA
jgi:hypothetical protein